MRLFALALPLLGFAVAACSQVDNSGGPPPVGDELAFEDLTVPADFFCDALADDALLLKSADDIDVLYDVCFPGTDTPHEQWQEWVDRVEALDDGDALVFAVGSAGGCVGQAWIQEVRLDESTLRPWMLKEDSSFNNRSVGCTADWAISQHLVRVEGGAAADSVELAVGAFNPDMPGGPEAPATL